jgi:hypothetical protein
MNEFPSWLKSMQNGSIGEARTRAFLIDRFWILERSVDIHGVDFVEQRRLYDRSILDDKPPRFGVVQSKFSQDENTSHCLDKEDIVDEGGNPRIEFFLIINTGDEENQKMYLLRAEDISKGFPINKDGKYVVSSRKVLSSSRYQIENRRRSLDRMEQSIQCAEFYKNRSFIFSRLSSVNPDFDAILPDYREEIEHGFGDIPEWFKKSKQEAFDAIVEIERIHGALKEYVESIDPIEACYIAEGFSHRFGTSVRLPQVFSRDFYYAAKNLKEMVDDMRKDGVLDNYISARRRMLSEVSSFLSGYSPDEIDSNTVHQITVEYDPASLSFLKTSNSISQVPEAGIQGDFSRFVLAQEGKIVFSWRLGLQVKRDGYLKMNDVCARDIMQKVYGLKYLEGEQV